MLIPHYQGAIKAAHQMDTGTATKDTDGAEHWKVIDAAVGSFTASDRAQLASMFAPAASGKTNFCTVQTLLLRNLPGSSNLQYGSDDCINQGCKDIGTRTRKDKDVQHVTAKDVGVLEASLHTDGSEKECTYPPPAPPPLVNNKEPASWVGATVVLTLTASGSVSDYSNLRDLTENIATAAGLASSLVTVSVAAASVIITATINVPAALTAASVQTLLSSKLGTAATASAALGIDVESDPTMIATEVQQESSDSGLTDGEIAGVAIGATVGGIVLLGLVGLILRSIMFKEAKPVFTCLEKAPAKSPA
jgi:hypothetical protein